MLSILSFGKCDTADRAAMLLSLLDWTNAIANVPDAYSLLILSVKTAHVYTTLQTAFQKHGDALLNSSC